MRLADHIRDNRIVLLVCFGGGLAFSLVLYALGIEAAELALLWLCFLLLLAAVILAGYLRRKRRTQYLLSLAEALDQKYLLAELAEKPEGSLERVYFQLMKTALKAMTDEVAQAKRQNAEYRDFIEQWIHEIKSPITGIQLLCENNKTEATRKISAQTELIERDVEKVLFYARLGSVEKDYLIREISLKACVMETLAQNRQYMMQNGACVDTDGVTDTVYSDSKWVCFILNQIIINSVKYKSDRPLRIQIRSQNMENCVALSVTDNGIGIKESELSRVFDKGFVGSNGRAGKNATGMGLYLCERLCANLGIHIEISSQAGQYTSVTLYFPKSDHLRV